MKKYYCSIITCFYFLLILGIIQECLKELQIQADDLSFCRMFPKRQNTEQLEYNCVSKFTEEKHGMNNWVYFPIYLFIIFAIGIVIVMIWKAKVQLNLKKQDKAERNISVFQKCANEQALMYSKL